MEETIMGAKASTAVEATTEATVTKPNIASDSEALQQQQQGQGQQMDKEGVSTSPPSGENVVEPTSSLVAGRGTGNDSNDDHDDDDELFMTMLRSGYEGGIGGSSNKVPRAVSERSVLSIKTTSAKETMITSAPSTAPASRSSALSFFDKFKTKKVTKEESSSTKIDETQEKKKKEEDKTEIPKDEKTSSDTPVPKSTVEKIFALPFLNILQGIFMITLIGQQFPALENHWPFSLLHGGKDGSNNGYGDGVSPLYAELRKDMYGHYKQFPTAIKRDPLADANPFLSMLLSGPPKPPPPKIPTNTGIPKQEFIHITNINHEYESFRYSVQAATASKAQAAIELRQTSFQRALSKTLARVTDLSDVKRLILLEAKFLKDATKLMDQLVILRSSAMCNSTTIDNATDAANEFLDTDICTNYTHSLSELKDDETSSCAATDNNTCDNISTMLANDDGVNTTTVNNDTIVPNSTAPAGSNILSTEEITLQIYELGADFLAQLKKSLEPGPANAICDAIEGHAATQGFPQVVKDLQRMSMSSRFIDDSSAILSTDLHEDDPLRSIISSNSLSSTTTPQKRLFVINFEGDMMATQVSALRKEVTAIVRSAVPSQGDEVLVVLQSGGGTVTGYGLVAGQLIRLKDAGLKLTIAVEQVAASGGYMAACIGHNIVCSPFAVVGSIGVVTEMPNVYERLHREGVTFVEVTAGEYKRVLSPTRNITDKDLVKAREEMEDVWTLFKDFVSEQRPSLDIKKVATGEIWFGQKAVDVGLCDSIRAADDILLDYVSRGYDAYRVKYQEPSDDKLEQLLEEWFHGALSSNILEDFFGHHSHGASSLIRWFKKKGLPKLYNFLHDGAETRFRAEDDPRQRYLMI